MSDSNFYEAHSPNPGVPERGTNTYEKTLADNEHRRGRGTGQEFAFEGLGPNYHGAFVQGVVSAHQGVEQYPARADHTGRAPAPAFPERARQQYDVTIAGQADGRNPLGAVNPPPTWDQVDRPQLGNFADAAQDDAHGVYEVRVVGKGGRRRNQAQVFKP